MGVYGEGGNKIENLSDRSRGQKKIAQKGKGHNKYRSEGAGGGMDVLSPPPPPLTYIMISP